MRLEPLHRAYESMVAARDRVEVQVRLVPGRKGDRRTHGETRRTFDCSRWRSCRLHTRTLGCLSRRWRQRKNVQSIALYIFDEIHMIGDHRVGPTYEIVASRARFVAAQMQASTRMIALSVPLANARDPRRLARSTEWKRVQLCPGRTAGADGGAIQTFNIPHFLSMMIAKAKPPTWRSSSMPKTSRSCVVPSRKQAKLTAEDLLAYVVADKRPDRRRQRRWRSRFLNIEMEDLEPHLQRGRIESCGSCSPVGLPTTTKD